LKKRGKAMKNISVERLFIEPMERFYENVLQYLPNVISFLLLIIAGFLLGIVVRIIFTYVLRLIKVDTFSERWGLQSILARGGIREHLSALLARLLGWLTIFVFVVIALSVLEVPEVEHLLRNFFLYLPNVIVAVVILFLGYFLGNFLARAILITAVNAGMGMPGAISRGVKIAIYVLAVTMSLEQLGIGRETIIIAFTIIFGGTVFAFSLALGLGGKDMAREYLERVFEKGQEKKEEREEKRPDDIQHL
jgi:hypothetical protein